MEYLHEFATQAQCSAYMESEDYKEPFVGLIDETTDVEYNKQPAIDYRSMPLTFEFIDSGYFFINVTNSSNSSLVSYKLNDDEWIEIDYNEELNVAANDILQIKGYDFASTSNSGASLFSTDARFNVYGNIMSLIDYDFEELEDLYGYKFSFIFGTGPNHYGGGGDKVISAENLVLPATTLSNYCYWGMFYGCSGLTTAPAVLPASTLANGCYRQMFADCTSLTSAPELAATTLADICYGSMFYGCTSLTSAPELPATTLADGCYDNMFYGCTSLTTAPALPATTLAYGCYSSMFNGCTGLTVAPALPATTLATDCYISMFDSCTSLTTAPALPATTLAVQCYHSMFGRCTGLTTVPSNMLPATALTIFCYAYMFEGCENLIAAPELPATTLANNCYLCMFAGCTSLNYIKCLATDISATDCTNYWVGNVSSTGTFVKNPNMSSWTSGDDGIPTGWTVEDAS